MSRRAIIIIAAVAALVVAGISVYAVSNNQVQEPVQQPSVQVQQEVQQPVQQPEVQQPEASPSQQPIQQDGIGLEEAKQVALKQVPGASSADIVKAYQDYDDGILEYEVEIHYNGYEYDYEILGSSGEIISKDVDHIEWDDRYDD